LHIEEAKVFLAINLTNEYKFHSKGFAKCTRKAFSNFFFKCKAVLIKLLQTKSKPFFFAKGCKAIYLSCKAFFLISKQIITTAN